MPDAARVFRFYLDRDRMSGPQDVTILLFRTWRSHDCRCFIRRSYPTEFHGRLKRIGKSREWIYAPNRSICAGWEDSIFKTGAAGVGVELVGSTGVEWRSKNSFSFLKSSFSVGSRLPWCKAAAGCRSGKMTKSFMWKACAFTLVIPTLRSNKVCVAQLPRVQTSVGLIN